MKTELFIQYILSVFLILLALSMMVAAFVRDAPTIWKFFTAILEIVFYKIFKHIGKELKQ